MTRKEEWHADDTDHADEHRSTKKSANIRHIRVIRVLFSNYTSMKAYNVVALCLIGLLVTAEVGWAADKKEEDDIFSDAATVVSMEEATDDTILDVLNERSVTFSGEITGKFGYQITRDYLDDQSDFADNPYTTSIEGDLLLDVRLQKGIKAFADLWVSYTPQRDENDPFAENLQTSLKEFFVDANIKQKAYFRFGKQNLKWGRGYLWNPTDLISQDRKDFSDMDARLEGVYGLKMHIPFGTTWNIYSFVNASGANKVDEFSIAGKVEVLLPGNVEMSVSAWTKKDYVAVYGVDFATHKFSTDWRGELSLSNGDNRHRLEPQNGEYVDTNVKDEWVPRAALGFTRNFDYKDVKNRISLTGEFYYNHGGYDENMLLSATRDQFLEGGYFEPNNYGKYYAALFASYQKFLHSDVTLNLNVIGNLSDSSFMVMSGVNYGVMDRLALNCNLKDYLGEKDREYTLSGNALGVDVSLDLAF